MKILLREHVDHLGRRGETVTVAAGYARNYLLPKGLALRATPGNLKVLETQSRIWESTEAKETEQAQALAARLGQLQLSITKKAGESGTLYGSVTTMEIAGMLAAQGVMIDRRRITIGDAIKSVGDHEVSVRLHQDVTGKVKLQVLSDAGPAPSEVVIDETVRDDGTDDEFAE